MASLPPTFDGSTADTAPVSDAATPVQTIDVIAKSGGDTRYDAESAKKFWDKQPGYKRTTASVRGSGLAFSKLTSAVSKTDLPSRAILHQSILEDFLSEVNRLAKQEPITDVTRFSKVCETAAGKIKPKFGLTSLSGIYLKNMSTKNDDLWAVLGVTDKWDDTLLTVRQGLAHPVKLGQSSHGY